MPFIDCKISKKLTEEQKDNIKTQLGKAISNMRKTESYLMVGICDGYDLYFAGKKLDSGAFVDIRAFGRVSPADCQKMTASVCTILSQCAGVLPSSTYITYDGYENWGWNGSNF